MKFAKWVYRIAGIYGLLVLAPLLFLERVVSQTSPPALTHPEYYYGFAITGAAWQVAFLVISNDPRRFRPVMPVTWLEKSYGFIAVVLYFENRVSSQVLVLGLIDLLLGALFIGAYVTTTQTRVLVIHDQIGVFNEHTACHHRGRLRRPEGGKTIEKCTCPNHID